MEPSLHGSAHAHAGVVQGLHQALQARLVLAMVTSARHPYSNCGLPPHVCTAAGGAQLAETGHNPPQASAPPLGLSADACLGQRGASPAGAAIHAAVPRLSLPAKRQAAQAPRWAFRAAGPISAICGLLACHNFKSNKGTGSIGSQAAVDTLLAKCLLMSSVTADMLQSGLPSASWRALCADAELAGGPVSYEYVPGAGDDEESWAAGLTPALFWSHKQVSPCSLVGCTFQLTCSMQHGVATVLACIKWLTSLGNAGIVSG